MPLADYLASKYLSASTPNSSSSKKRKRKSKGEGLTIADDDANDWTRPTANASDDEDAPVVVDTSSSTSTKLKGGLNRPSKSTTNTTKWKTFGTTAPKDTDQLAADAILASAQAENARRAAEDDEAPTILEEAAGGAVMANGAAAGLQSAAQVSLALARREKEEKKKMSELGLQGKEAETVYRDAAGRVINVKKIRGEREEREREEERRKKEEREGAKGDVQRRMREERQQELEVLKGEGVARGVDDERLNAELRGVERWEDPMARMMGKSKGGEGRGKRGAEKGKRTYQGAFEPNRYGIKPGWRWDGVDRGNGFERRWFAARNKAKDREELEYAWQLDE